MGHHDYHNHPERPRGRRTHGEELRGKSETEIDQILVENWWVVVAAGDRGTTGKFKCLEKGWWGFL